MCVCVRGQHQKNEICAHTLLSVYVFVCLCKAICNTYTHRIVCVYMRLCVRGKQHAPHTTAIFVSTHTDQVGVYTAFCMHMGVGVCSSVRVCVHV